MHECDQNVHAKDDWKVGIQCHATFLFHLSSEARGSFSTSKSDQDWLSGLQLFVPTTASSIWPQAHVTWHKVFYFKHIILYPVHVQYYLEQLKSPLFKWFKKLPIIQKIIPGYFAYAYHEVNDSKGIGGHIIHIWHPKWPFQCHGERSNRLKYGNVWLLL